MKHLLPVTIFYFFLAALYFILESLNPAWLITLLAKALPMILLILFFARNSGLKERKDVLLFTGLIFALIGDLLLQWNNRNPSFFLYGLASFLLTQLFYSLALFTGGELYSKILKIWPAIILGMIYGFILVGWLKPNLGDMFIPVTVYASIIILMSLGAYSRISVYHTRGANITLLGALLFLSSDSMIAINRFGHPFDYSRFFILLTYFLAQYFIVYGILHPDNPTPKGEARVL